MKIEDLNNFNEKEAKELLTEFYNSTDDMIKPIDAKDFNCVVGEHIYNCRVVLDKIDKIDKNKIN